MKRGFTLLELIVVIIILGILATLGLTQYSRMIEKSRGAEVRAVFGAIRNNAAAIYMQNTNDCTNCSAANIGLGTDYPTVCAATHYFAYTLVGAAAPTGLTLLATRCLGAAGKQPGGVAPAGTIQLAINFTAGTDAWTYTGQYQ